MEIVYASNFKDKFKTNEVNIFYGDILDLMNMGIDVEGIIYDDEWTVKRFLGLFKNSKRIKSVFNYLEINTDLLNKKIKELSKTDFKWILLAYIIINKYKYIIFDYLDVALIYKDKKKLIKIIRKLCDDGINIIVISNDLVFLSNFNNRIYMYSDISGLEDMDILELSKTNMVEIPNVIEFINEANSKGASLEYTLDSKELLKDIYRGVK